MSTLRKTPKMRRLEEARGGDIETWLPQVLADHGYDGAAKALGVTKATIYFWADRLHLRQSHLRIILRADEVRAVEASSAPEVAAALKGDEVFSASSHEPPESDVAPEFTLRARAVKEDGT